MFREQMKTKSFLLLLLCIFLTSSFVYLLGNETPNFAHNFVSETHKKIVKDLRKLNTEIKSRHQLSVGDRKLLTQLGFVSSPRLYPQDVPHNVTPPVFVTTVTSSQYSHALKFISSVYRHFPKVVLVVYGIDLSHGHSKELRDQCNCTFRDFELSHYPSHVSTLSLGAYIPIAIQECLRDFGAVVYLDVSLLVTRSSVGELLRRAASRGVQAWFTPSKDATTAYTHPKMLEFFGCKKQDFYFQRMVGGDSLVVYNLAPIHTHLMLPWVQCSLIENCISPIGSQANGCVDKRPSYLYSGCHRYHVSALNVALGILFNNSVTNYTSSSPHKFFMSPSEARDVAVTMDRRPEEDGQANPAHHRHTHRRH